MKRRGERWFNTVLVDTVIGCDPVPAAAAGPGNAPSIGGIYLGSMARRNA